MEGNAPIISEVVFRQYCDWLQKYYRGKEWWIVQHSTLYCREVCLGNETWHGMCWERYAINGKCTREKYEYNLILILQSFDSQENSFFKIFEVETSHQHSFF